MTQSSRLVAWVLMAFLAPGFALAQDREPDPGPDGGAGGAPPPGGGTAPGGAGGEGAAPPPPGDLEARIARLEQQAEDDDDDDRPEWVFRVHGGYFDLEEDPDDRVVPIDDDDDEGWAVGIDVFAPMWVPEGDDDDGDGDGDGDAPFGTYMRFTLDYRQLGDDESSTGGGEGSVDYINFIVGPTLRFHLGADDDDGGDDDGGFGVIPYVYTGLNFMIASPPSDEVSELDLGWVIGTGVELRVTPRFGFGAEYQYTFFGVADMEDEDYHQVNVFVSFYH